MSIEQTELAGICEEKKTSKAQITQKFLLISTCDKDKKLVPVDACIWAAYRAAVAGVDVQPVLQLLHQAPHLFSSLF